MREKEKDHYEEKAGEHEQDLDNAFEDLADKDGQKFETMQPLRYGISGTELDDFRTNYLSADSARTTALNNILGIADAAKTTSTTVNSAKSSRETTARNAVNTAKTENKNIRKETDQETEKEHKNSENDGWNAYYTATVSAGTAYLTSYKQAENTFKTTSVQAEDAYSTTVLPAAKEFENEICRLYGRFYDAIEQANLGFGVDATFYANGATSTNVQVCFVAGTPVLLSDGTSKAIEEIAVGDEVFARPHDNPTGELVKCKVVRTFVNQKDTWSLTIRNLQTQECLVIRGTSEHPFYVQGKGWTSLGTLREGDQLVSATGEMMLVLSKEHHPEVVEVYNFEVEDAHTYYVGETTERSVLVHNDCWDYINYSANVTGAFLYGFCITGPYNIGAGTCHIVKEMGCQAIDLGGGVVTCATMPFMDSPIVFDPWSDSLKALDQGYVSTGRYYVDTGANLVTAGTYGQLQTGYYWWNGNITDDEASKRFGGTAMMQFGGAYLMQQTGGVYTCRLRDIPATLTRGLRPFEEVPLSPRAIRRFQNDPHFSEILEAAIAKPTAGKPGSEIPRTYGGALDELILTLKRSGFDEPIQPLEGLQAPWRPSCAETKAIVSIQLEGGTVTEVINGGIIIRNGNIMFKPPCETCVPMIKNNNFSVYTVPPRVPMEFIPIIVAPPNIIPQQE